MAFVVVLVIMTMVMIVGVGVRLRLVVGVVALHNGMLACEAVRCRVRVRTPS